MPTEGIDGLSPKAEAKAKAKQQQQQQQEQEQRDDSLGAKRRKKKKKKFFEENGRQRDDEKQIDDAITTTATTKKDDDADEENEQQNRATVDSSSSLLSTSSTGSSSSKHHHHNQKDSSSSSLAKTTSTPKRTTTTAKVTPTLTTNSFESSISNHSAEAAKLVSRKDSGKDLAADATASIAFADVVVPRKVFPKDALNVNNEEAKKTKMMMKAHGSSLVNATTNSSIGRRTTTTQTNVAAPKSRQQHHGKLDVAKGQQQPQYMRKKEAIDDDESKSKSKSKGENDASRSHLCPNGKAAAAAPLELKSNDSRNKSRPSSVATGRIAAAAAAGVTPSAIATAIEARGKAADAAASTEARQKAVARNGSSLKAAATTQQQQQQKHYKADDGTAAKQSRRRRQRTPDQRQQKSGIDGSRSASSAGTTKIDKEEGGISGQIEAQRPLSVQMHGRKLMPAATTAKSKAETEAASGAVSQQQQQQQPTTTASNAAAGHAKSSEQPAMEKALPEAGAAIANRSVRVKSTNAALLSVALSPSSSISSASLQQPLSFANSKLQSTRLKTTIRNNNSDNNNNNNHSSATVTNYPQSKPPSNDLNQRSIEDIAGKNLLLKATKLFPKNKLPLAASSSTTTIKMADQAVIDKLEAGFAKLQAATPEQCHSLLKKYLTREVLDKTKAKKTAMGASLLDVCQSGFENLDSGVGIYAPDAESYTLFSDLFNPIIEDYHGGFKSTDKHPASDFGDLESLVNVDPDNQFVISTRVRCGRSLKGYPFNPCLTEAQYKEMEQKVSTTLKEVEGDLAGTYYPLTGMTKETQQQLIDDHFLFKEGDRFLQAANACRYWPTGRGIYHNKEKTFLVWVNEEDHLRIISMQKGGDLKTVFSRLVSGARAIEAKVPFSRDDRLGFLTFCPTNLGTTIRASVHIKLPKLAADRKKLEEVASRYNLQVRGTSGEHTESVGGVYDISNKRRLGLTEYQAVREMQDGILELIKIEKSL